VAVGIFWVDELFGEETIIDWSALVELHQIESKIFK